MRTVRNVLYGLKDILSLPLQKRSAMATVHEIGIFRCTDLSFCDELSMLDIVPITQPQSLKTEYRHD